MAYIGASGALTNQATVTDVFNGNGSNTQFTLSRTVYNTRDIEVVVNNVQQSPFDGSYSVSGQTLTFSGAPTAGANNIYVIYQAGVIGVVSPTDNSVTANSIQSNAVTTAKLSDSGVTAGTYGNTTVIPVITVDAKGRTTSVTTAPVNQANGVIHEFSTTVTSSYTLSTGKNAMSVGPVTVANGSAVTVPPGQRWVIL
jgi:hypothetical protein